MKAWTALFLLLPAQISAYPQDLLLSKKLFSEYRETIRKTDTGKDFYERFEALSSREPRILLRYSKGDGLAYYVPKKDVIYLNTKYIRMFFSIKGYSDEKIIKAFNTDSAVRKEFVSYSDSVFFHELVHCLQNRKYGRAYYMKEGTIFIEFEYEAFFLSDMYFYEKMKNNRKLFYELLAGKYWDIYTGSDLAGYLKITMDPEKYKREIESRYADEMGGYVPLSFEETRKKVRADESRLLSMAGGSGWEKEKQDLQEIERQKKEYEAFIKDFYEKKWPVFAPQAFFYTLEVSTQAENFSLALSLVSEAEKNIESYSISEAEKTRLKTACALVFLQAADFFRDKSSTLTGRQKFFLLYNLDRACISAGREFPSDLREEKERLYRKTLKELLKESETVSKQEKEEISEIIKFLTSSVSGGVQQ